MWPFEIDLLDFSKVSKFFGVAESLENVGCQGKWVNLIQHFFRPSIQLAKANAKFLSSK
jgi:hypothetical protein